MVHVIHPTGNTFVRALLGELEASHTEYHFWTTIAASRVGWAKHLPGRLRATLERRAFDVPKARLGTRPTREWIRLLAPAFKMRFLTRHETGWASVDAVYRDLDHSIAQRVSAINSCTAEQTWVYGYEDGCLESFEMAKKLGVRRAYELPIAYWETSRKLLSEEAERWPEWAGTLVGPRDSEAKLERKTRELDLAEVIVVPSAFVERSLPGTLRDKQRVVVAPFGTPVIPPTSEGGCIRQDQGKLRVLFAGSMTQRKGLADVFEAFRRLKRSDVELVVMGSPVLPLEFYQAQGISFIYEAPRPHHQVLSLMQSCDVLLLPSIVEGRALVQQEALACGLPILVTANAGAEDLIVEGETGFLLPIRSPQAIADILSWCADHRMEIKAMRPACRAKAAACTWERYSQTILDALDRMSGPDAFRVKPGGGTANTSSTKAHSI
jgi:glycosyltransferase involved in cell wall biosynthesis